MGALRLIEQERIRYRPATIANREAFRIAQRNRPFILERSAAPPAEARTSGEGAPGSTVSNGCHAAVMQAVCTPATVAGTDVVIAKNEFHRPDPFHHLVPELIFQAQPQRCTVGNG